MALERMFRLSHNKLVSRRGLSFPGKLVRHGWWFAPLLLAVGGVLGSSVTHARALVLAIPLENYATTIAGSQLPSASGMQSAEAKGKAAAPSDVQTEAIQSAIERVHTPSLQALATALGLSVEQIGHRAFEDSETGMEPLIINGESSPSEVAVKWKPHALAGSGRPEAEPDLYLLSWNGRSWQVSYLTPALDALTVQVLPGTESATSLIAVIIFHGTTAVPYPVIFRFSEHHASLVWDGRKPTSFYSGYDYGSIQFKRAKNADVPLMVASGFADPGLLVFPNSSERSGRGFQVVTAYAWQNDAYVQIRTEYVHNRDYTLYRFISALHLHEYKTAYSLTKPEQFLKTDKPTLKLFRERVLKSWPEFTQDRIFEVPPGPERSSESHKFVLRLKDKKMYVYQPTFTSGPPYLLTGLSRTETSQ